MNSIPSPKLRPIRNLTPQHKSKSHKPIGTVVNPPEPANGTVVKPPEPPNGTDFNPPESANRTVVNPRKPPIGTNRLLATPPGCVALRPISARPRLHGRASLRVGRRQPKHLSDAVGT
jgi:hypothetical protein